MSKLLTLLLFTGLSSAQQIPVKLNDVSIDELLMEKCSFYPDANSMIISQKGVLWFELDVEKGWQIVLKKTVRKKVFSKSDTDTGNISINIYEPENSGTDADKIHSFKAYSHNLENGKISSVKINRKDRHKRRLNKYWSEVNYAVPNVREGTVIEYEYHLKSQFISNLMTWNFQYLNVPVGYSEFTYTIPEWLNYQTFQLGNVIKIDWESKKKREVFTYDLKSRRELVSYSSIRSGISREILPILDEPYATNFSDIPSRVEFQLMSINYENQIPKVIAGTYSRFNEELLTSYKLGKRLSNGGFIKDHEEQLSNLSPIAKAKSVFTLIQHKLRWNGKNGIFSLSSGRPTYKNEEGSVADINLTLIAALRELNIEAYPVILSTRGHGTVHPTYPNYEKFNYLIAIAFVEGHRYLLDAASKMPFGQLPIKCRNGNGWLIDENKKSWVNLKANSKSITKTLIDISVEDDTLRTKVAKRMQEYASYNEINKSKNKSKSELVEELETRFPEFVVENYTFDEKSSYDKPLDVSYTLKAEMEDPSLIYIQPLIDGIINENPFVRETRTAPIDFPYQIHQVVLAKMTVPVGYEAELPESVILALPENAGKFSFISREANNRISLKCDIVLSKTNFNAEEYAYLREFFETISAKTTELIVLNKI